MKKQTSFLSLALIVLALSFIFSSCRKREKEQQDKDTEQGTANDHTVAEGIVNDIETMGSQVSENSALTTYRTSGPISQTGEDFKLASVCATVTGAGTQTVTVDFGTGCIGLDGRIRMGKLIYNFSGSNPASATHYRNPGFNMVVTSQNYAVDGHQVNILSKNVTNTTPGTIPSGPNPGTNLTWSISASVSIIKPNNAGTISWTCNRVKELLNTSSSTCYQGQATAIDWQQAQIQLNGSATGINAKGENFTATATNLIRYFTCSPDPNRPRRHPFISGTIAYTPGTRPTRLIDFGNVNSCDLIAAVTINNQTFTITLP